MGGRERVGEGRQGEGVEEGANGEVVGERGGHKRWIGWGEVGGKG